MLISDTANCQPRQQVVIPGTRLKIYPDSAHGFLFQHHAQFAADVDAFLASG